MAAGGRSRTRGKRSAPDVVDETPEFVAHMSPVQRERLEYKPQLSPVFERAPLAFVCWNGVVGEGFEWLDGGKGLWEGKIFDGRDKTTFFGCFWLQTERGEISTTPSDVDESSFRRVFNKTLGQPLLHVVGEDRSGSGGGGRKVTIGVVFCGRQSPGGHNVVAGLVDAVARGGGAGSKVLGFLDGTVGFFEGKSTELDEDAVRNFRNMGGYHLLGRSVDQIRTADQMKKAEETCRRLKLDGLVLIGGCYSTTDAAHLAERFARNNVGTAVVGVPVTVDGDLTGPFVEATLGFDTFTKEASFLIGNMASDANSAQKYWFFVRQLGREPSHVTLECALQTQPNVCLLGEDVEARKLSLADIVNEIADAVAARAAKGKNFGVVLVPEGLVRWIPELRTLIDEMNRLFARGEERDAVADHLTPWSRAVLDFLPRLIREQLFYERESHGTVQLSQISTERLLAELVEGELERRTAAGTFAGKFSTICTFLGYQSRTSLPSNFDCDYGQNLGHCAAALVVARANGYMATIRNLAKPADAWEPAGVPLTALMEFRKTPNGIRAIIPSRPVSTSDGPYLRARDEAARWLDGEHYLSPGPIQFRGKTANLRTRTLRLQRSDYMARLHELYNHLDELRTKCRPGVSDRVLDAALSGAASLHKIISLLAAQHED